MAEIFELVILKAAKKAFVHIIFEHKQTQRVSWKPGEVSTVWKQKLLLILFLYKECVIYLPAKTFTLSKSFIY